MSDGVYTRAGWQPLPAEGDETLYTEKKRRGVALVWAMICLAAALCGVVLLRHVRKGREV